MYTSCFQLACVLAEPVNSDLKLAASQLAGDWEIDPSEIDLTAGQRLGVGSYGEVRPCAAVLCCAVLRSLCCAVLCQWRDTGAPMT
jgi:hypothetical protein